MPPYGNYDDGRLLFDFLHDGFEQSLGHRDVKIDEAADFVVEGQTPDPVF